jgi:hypothetical protein
MAFCTYASHYFDTTQGAVSPCVVGIHMMRHAQAASRAKVTLSERSFEFCLLQSSDDRIEGPGIQGN